MAFHRRIQKHGNRQNGQSSADPDLSVVGYSSKLHEPSPAIDGGGAGDEEKYLIPWNGDEQLKIDRALQCHISIPNLFQPPVKRRRKSTSFVGRTFPKIYDARLYLSSLDEFNEWKGKTKQNEEEESAEDLAEKLEEELCEEQRYMDFYAALKNDEIDEEKKKKAEKRAEIGFNYEQMEPKIEENEEKEEEIDPADEDEPFEKPESLKLPVGIVTPDTMRQNALIERTAAFVVSKGPQMEVVIKAKQRQRADQFDFLDFDHRLHPYYKYLCKLIREKKYTPNLNATPSSRIAKNKKVDVQNESEEDESDNDDDDGYLHPLLRGGGEKTTENVGGFIGPVKKPPMIQKKSEIMEPKMNNPLILIHGNLPNTNESSLYSSLMKGLHALLPKKEEEKTLSIEDEKRQSPKPTKSSNNNEEIQFEMDIERINDYNKWHLEFYGRPSPYLPGPPPIPLPPLPDSAVESGITVAAKYVALHGASAEQRLIEHNGDKVHFLLARSPYYTFYQSNVRQLQWKLFQQSQKMQQQVSQSAIIPPISLLEQISPLPTISQQMNSTTGNVPIEIKINECGRNEEEIMASSNLIDKKQQERKEKARLFMERILNERLAEKHKKGTMKPAEVKEESSEIGNEQNELMKKKTKRRSGFDDKFGEIASTSAAGTSSGNLTPSQLSKTISSLIDQQLQKTFASKETTPPSNSSNSLKKRKREKKHRKLDSSDESDYSADSRSEKVHRKRRKRAKTKEDENNGAEKKHRRKSSINRRRRKRKSDRRSSHSSSDSKSSTE